MRAIARHANVHAKFSGLLTEPNAVVADVFDTLWESFGPERLIWGSDWPVLRLAADYGHWLESARAIVPVEHHQAVFGANARRVYRL